MPLYSTLTEVCWCDIHHTLRIAPADNTRRAFAAACREVVLPEVFRLPGNAVCFLLKKLCVDGLIPSMQAIPHLFDSLRHLGGKVVSLADIGYQVVKVHATVFVAFNQLEVTFSNGATGDAALIAVMRVVS